MDHPFITDLKFAQTTGVAAEIILRNGMKLLTGVSDVDSEHHLVSVYDPQTLDDVTTRRRLNAGDIVSVTVTEIPYRPT